MELIIMIDKNSRNWSIPLYCKMLLRNRSDHLTSMLLKFWSYVSSFQQIIQFRQRKWNYRQ